MLSCEFFKFFKNTFFYRTPPVAASKFRRETESNEFDAEAERVALGYQDIENCSQK